MNTNHPSLPCTEEDRAFIRDKLDSIDRSIAPPLEGDENETRVFRITDDKENIIAGCVLKINRWKTAYLDTLWVDEKHRRKGLGSALLFSAEKTARQSACRTMYLFTFDFQARPFYEKNGYTLCGTLGDFPKGHETYFLMKRLDRPSEGNVHKEDTSAPLGILPGDDKDAGFIGDRLGEYNASRVPRTHEYVPVSRKLLDGNGSMIAAIFSGVGTRSQFEIDMIWVDEPYRNQGIGSGLLAEAELEAKGHGAYLAFTAVLYDWQADFFRKNGYTAAFSLEDCPEGHCMFVMEKRL